MTRDQPPPLGVGRRLDFGNSVEPAAAGAVAHLHAGLVMES